MSRVRLLCFSAPLKFYLVQKVTKTSLEVIKVTAPGVDLIKPGLNQDGAGDEIMDVVDGKHDPSLRREYQK